MAKIMEKVKGFYNEKVLRKFNNALKKAIELVKSGEDLRVRISNKNSKMGEVASVSLLPFLTCPDCCKTTCGKKCYAAKLANMRKQSLFAYAINTALVMCRPDVFWAQVNAAVMAVRFFRFHVSGDIINMDYFLHMIEIAKNNPYTEILVFTKRYSVVNEWIDKNGKLPENLHILFSGWKDLDPINPHNLPETNVILKGEETFPENWKICGGNCFNCACRGLGCWKAAAGEVIAFHEH